MVSFTRIFTPSAEQRVITQSEIASIEYLFQMLVTSAFDVDMNKNDNAGLNVYAKNEWCKVANNHHRSKYLVGPEEQSTELNVRRAEGAAW